MSTSAQAYPPPQIPALFDLAAEMISLVFGPDDRPVLIMLSTASPRIEIETQRGNRAAIRPAILPDDDGADGE